MNNEELQNKIQSYIRNLGINPLFTENPAYKYISNDILNPLIKRMGSSNDVDIKNNDHNITFQDEYQVKENEETLNKKIRLRIRKNTENSFECIFDILEDIPGTLSKKHKELSKIKIRIDQEGNIYINESYSFVNNINNDQGKLIGNITCTSIVFDNNGIMIRRDTKTYNNLEYRNSIEFIPPEDMLYIETRAFDIQSDYNINYDHRICMVRESFDTAHIDIEDKGEYDSYSGSVLLDGNESLSILELPENFDMKNKDVITPLDDKEIKEKIDKETDYQIKMGLYQYVSNRNKLKESGFRVQSMH